MSEWGALAALATAGATFALARGVALALGEGHRHSRDRLASFGAVEAASPSSQAGSKRRRSARARGDGTVSSARRWLRRAGLAWEPADLAGMTVASAAVPGAIVGAITNAAVPSVTIGLLGALLPLLVIHRRVSRRSAALNAQVVETLEVVASSLRSGFGFTQSLDLAAREQPEPISGELLQAIHEVNLGASTDEALQRLVDRTGDADLALAVNAVVIQRRVGGDLSEVLGNIAHMIRERIRIRGEIKTLTAQARMSAWIIGLLPIALAAVLTLMQPEQMRVLIDDPIGRVVVLVGGGLQIIGFMAVQRVAAIEY
ncbi:MAG: type II secretion system F family protein [Dehalococcoidia bacterium]|nr:type II secretion system F family protein [Dehalococcoidia bacterium]